LLDATTASRPQTSHGELARSLQPQTSGCRGTRTMIIKREAIEIRIGSRSADQSRRLDFQHAALSEKTAHIGQDRRPPAQILKARARLPNYAARHSLTRETYSPVRVSTR